MMQITKHENVQPGGWNPALLCVQMGYKNRLGTGSIASHSTAEIIA
jgi:hypothetical protein